MIDIPILRSGQPYTSLDSFEIVHHATGDPVARISQANPGMIVRDVHRMDDRVLESFAAADLLKIAKKAADLYMTATLPLGDGQQSFDDYIAQLSATTGSPISYCRTNAQKIHRVLDEMDVIVAGLTRGFDLSILDSGFGDDDGRMLSYYRAGRIFGAVLPSNSPGVHGLWIPALALKAPIVLKPGREEPWTPYRVIQAMIAAGAPKEAFGFYPTDHAGAGELLRVVDRSMLFGDARTTRPWQNDPRVEIHGPGYSKVLFGSDASPKWKDHLDLVCNSISANGGRSCINASSVYMPSHGRELAEAIAERFAKVEALPADDPKAQVAAFANPAVAEAISGAIDAGLREAGAVDLAMEKRGGPRLVKKGRIAYLLPTVIWAEDRDHPLVGREFLFPFAAVVEAPQDEIPSAIGPTLVGTAITGDKGFIAALMSASNVDRLNVGAIPTYQLSWDQPHEGNLFEHLYRQRAFQFEPAA